LDSIKEQNITREFSFIAPVTPKTTDQEEEASIKFEHED
jgi:preprotein translocase subunit SecB